MTRLETEIIKVLAGQSLSFWPDNMFLPITSERVFVLCNSQNSFCKLQDTLEDLVERNLVEEITKRGFKPTYRLIKTEVDNKSVAEPEPDPPRVPLLFKDFMSAKELRQMPLELLAKQERLAKQRQLQEQYNYLRRSLGQSQRLLDDYLESITDLAIIQLEQLAEPAEEENGTNGIERSGTG